MIKKTEDRIPWLDFLRFISALLVVIAHCRANFFAIFSHLAPNSQTLSTKIFYLSSSFSDDAVFIFFILSGFLVGGPLLEKLNRHKDVNWVVFSISRFVRILLPLFATLVLCIFVYYLQGQVPSYLRILGNALSLQGLFVESEGGVLWTMPYIVWSYVFLLSLILLSKRNNSIRIPGLFLFCLTISFFLSFPHPKCFLAVALGVFTYYLRRIKLPKWLIVLCIIIALTTSIIAKFAKPSISRDTSMLSFINLAALNFIESFSLSILISQLIRVKPTKKFSIKIDKISTKAAKFSYSLYLSHFIAIQLMLLVGFPQLNYVGLKSVGLFILEILICIGLGYVFYLIFERPTDVFRKRLLDCYNIKRCNNTEKHKPS